MAVMGPVDSEAFGRQLTRTAATAPAPIDHSAFDQMLKKYVNDKGRVNYGASRPTAGSWTSTWPC